MKDDVAFSYATQQRVHLKSVCKCIVDSGATKYMTSHRAAFDTYEVISQRKVRLDDNSVAEAIGMGSTIIGAKMRGIRNKVCITHVLHMLNMHQMTFTEVCKANATNFVHLCAGDDRSNRALASPT